MKPHIGAKILTLAILSCVLCCWSARAVPSAPWAAGSAINTIDRSPKAPSLAAFGDRLYMVWKAADASNRIFISWTSDGTNWSPGRTINGIDATPENPALAASPSHLYIAFKANDPSNTIYITGTDHPDGLWPPAHRINSSDTTSAAPALYYYNYSLCMAWSSARRPNRIYFRAFTEPFLHGGGTRINEVDETTKSPSLASWNGKLYLAWKAQDSNRILVASSPDGRSWSSGRRINSVDLTPESPVLFGTPHRLYLAFKSDDSFNSIYLTSVSDPDAVWPAAFTINGVDSTLLAPALGFYKGKLFMAWKANDPTDRLFATSSYAQESEFFFNYLGEYPADANPGWHEEVQGVAHDRNNWFITQTGTLWKVPVEVDLNHISPGRRGARRVSIGDYPALSAYHHFGDLDYLEVDGRGYLVVPVQGDAVPGIALFNSDSLAYVAHAYTHRSEMGWCAVDFKGRMYTSELGRNDTMLRYDVDWRDLIRRTTEARTSARPTVLLYEIRPSASIRLTSPAYYGQGGEISPSGELLYLIADGIHIIDLATGQRLIQSSNGSGPFNFEYSPTIPIVEELNEEPEGLTLWDLDDGRAPNIRGQLHVLLLDNDNNPDDIFFKHYGVGPVARRLNERMRWRWVVNGSVLNASGLPIDADIRVFLGSIELGHVTSEHGRFSIYDLPTGRYRVVASSSGREDLVGGQTVGSRLISPFFYSRWELRFP